MSYSATLVAGENEITDDESRIDYNKQDIYVYVPSIDGVSDDDLERLYRTCGIDVPTHKRPAEIQVGCGVSV